MAGRISSGSVKYSRVEKTGLIATDVTLTADEARNRYIRLAGALTQSIDLIVPAEAMTEWVVSNNTTDGGGGPWTVTIKTPSGTGIAIAHDRTAICAGDGTNIFRVTADAAP